MRIVLATQNPHKLQEMRDLFADVVCEWTSLAAYPHVQSPEETGATFEANARLKATAVACSTGEWALADDSGLCVDALNGAPGIYSARYAGAAGDAAANIAKLIAVLRGVSASQRTAAFVCVLALCRPTGETFCAEGRVHGMVIDTPRGAGGFGYDPIFLLPALGRTMAELTPAEKHRVSHRARAAEGMKQVLERIFCNGV